jgi:hypothetical protein
MTQGGYPNAMRASDDDRARVQTILNDAYAEGRVTKYEWERRAGDLQNAATWADLDELTADLPREYPGPPARPVPASPAWPAPQAQRTNGLAIAALACGVGQVVAWFPAGLAAIILGHKARRQIRETGEQGDGMALAGLVLGYIGIGFTLLLVVVIVLLAVAVTQHS